MSFLREASLDEKSFPPLAAFREAFGFISNFMRAQTLRPDLLSAELGLLGAVLQKDGELTRWQKERILIVCSVVNLSTYCVTAHCEMLRMLGGTDPDPDQIAVDHRATGLPEADKALLDFAIKLTDTPEAIAGDDIDALRQHGFRDSQILEAIIVIGLASFLNLVASGVGAVPDFHSKRDWTVKALKAVRE